MTGAFKRLTSGALTTAIVLAVAWAVCALVLVTLQPGAHQSNRVHRLAAFTAHSLNLARALNTELVANLEVETATNAGSASLQAAYERTDLNRIVFEKIWGRFNSSDFGGGLGGQIEKARQRLRELGDLRHRIRASEISAARAAEAYLGMITPLVALGSYFEDLELHNAAIDSPRKELVRLLKLAEAMSLETRAGLAVLSAGQLSAQIERTWRKAAKMRQAQMGAASKILKEGAAPRPHSENGLELLNKAALMSTDFLSAARSGQTSEFPSLAAWISASTNVQTSLYERSYRQRHAIGLIAEETARHLNLLVILVVTAATVITVIMLSIRSRRPAETLFVALTIALNVPLVIWATTAGPDFLADEFGVLEFAQAFALLMAAVLALVDAAKYSQPTRTAAILLSSVCAFLFFRELDLRVFDAPYWLVAVSTGEVRRAIFVIGGSATIIYAVSQFRNLIKLIPCALSWKIWPFVSWPILLILGEVVAVMTHDTRKDDLHGFWQAGQFWEELLELDAYIVLLYAAYVFGDAFRCDKQKKRSAPAKPPLGKTNSELSK